MPYQVARQMQLEKLLMKEVPKNTKPGEDEIDDYGKLLTELKEANNSARISDVVRRGTWARKLSRRISNVSNFMYNCNTNEHRKSSKNID